MSFAAVNAAFLRSTRSVIHLQLGKVEITNAIAGSIVGRSTGSLLFLQHLLHVDLILDYFLSNSLNGIGYLCRVCRRTAGLIRPTILLLLKKCVEQVMELKLILEQLKHRRTQLLVKQRGIDKLLSDSHS